jgi:hypothetical protein
MDRAQQSPLFPKATRHECGRGESSQSFLIGAPELLDLLDAGHNIFKSWTTSCGVFDELGQATKYRNHDPAAAASRHIEIDVIIGASAGGMTATIAGETLLFETASLEQPYNNSLPSLGQRFQPRGITRSPAGKKSTCSVLLLSKLMNGSPSANVDPNKKCPTK